MLYINKVDTGSFELHCAMKVLAEGSWTLSPLHEYIENSQKLVVIVVTPLTAIMEDQASYYTSYIYV